MKFYVASGLENKARAADIIAALEALGHSVTYNWTVHGDVRDKGEERMMQVASSEVNAVYSAEEVLILLPGGKGTHIEAGIALASPNVKRIILWSETGEELGGGKNTCVFYHHPRITRLSCSIDDLLNTVCKKSG